MINYIYNYDENSWGDGGLTRAEADDLADYMTDRIAETFEEYFPEVDYEIILRYGGDSLSYSDQSSAETPEEEEALDWVDGFHGDRWDSWLADWIELSYDEVGEFKARSGK